MENQMILRGTIVQSSKKFIADGAVVIKNDKIVDVDSWDHIKKNYDTSNIIGSKNHIVSPGFVNTHSHAVQTLFRGAADDLELLPWLENVILPGEASLTKNQLEASCRIGYGEMLLSGITTANDMLTANHADTGMKAAEESGIRGRVGKMLMDRNVPEGLLGETDEILEEAVTLAEKYPTGGKIQYSFTPRFIPTCSDQLMKESSREAKERNLMLHTHVSENKAECSWVEELTGKNYIEAMNQFGALGEHVILAHAVWTSEVERELIANTSTNISHNPSSNAKLASGVAPIPDYLKRSIPVGLATDGSPATGGHDFFLEMRLASFLQKATHHQPTIMPARTVFDLATRGGAEALNLEEIGKIEPSYKADIVVFNPRHPSAYPMYDPYSFITYTAQTRDISHVLVDGELQVNEGELVNPLDKYYQIAREYADEKPFLNFK